MRTASQERPITTVPISIDAVQFEKLQDFSKISQNYVKTLIPRQKRPGKFILSTVERISPAY